MRISTPARFAGAVPHTLPRLRAFGAPRPLRLHAGAACPLRGDSRGSAQIDETCNRELLSTGCLLGKYC